MGPRGIFCWWKKKKKKKGGWWRTCAATTNFALKLLIRALKKKATAQVSQWQELLKSDFWLLSNNKIILKTETFCGKMHFPSGTMLRDPRGFSFFPFLQASPCQVSDTSSYFLYFHCISFKFFHSVSWKWIFDLFPLNLSPMGLWSSETLHCVCDTAGYTGEKDQTPPPTQNIKR